jgi:uncharacterized protein (TIGR03435 family)
MVRAIARLALCVLPSIYGQPVAAQRFEVASVKPSNTDPRSPSGINAGHGRLNAGNVTVKRCIMGAYGVGPSRIFGGPDWLDSTRFDIIAKAEAPVGEHILMTMLQGLLADRFKLTLHRETRSVQAYILEVAKNGPKLAKGDGEGSSTNSAGTSIGAKNTTMDHFAEVLSRQMDFPVVNKTGLEGVFNLQVRWTREGARADDTSAEGSPSIFTAIQEQLGLRLRSQKTPVEILVIDHVEKPSEN